VAVDGVLARLAGGIIVSCQAPTAEPLSGPAHMAAFAAAAKLGGAAGIRANAKDEVRRQLRQSLEAPAIDLIAKYAARGAHLVA
jgi:N-acylglucosamine-6-phosphate 2-epimerase